MFKSFQKPILYAIISLILISVLCAFLSYKVPLLLRSYVTNLGDEIGYQIDYENLNISFKELSLELSDLNIKSITKKEPLLNVHKIKIALNLKALLHRKLHANELVIDSPKLTIVKDKNSSNWQNFIGALKKKFPEKNQDKQSPPLEFDIQKFHIYNGEISMVDKSSNFQAQLAPLNVELLDLSNIDKSGGISGVKSEYKIQVGSLTLPISANDKKIELHNIQFTGKFDLDKAKNILLNLNARIDDGVIDTKTSFKSQNGELRSEISFKNLSIAPLISILPVNEELITRHGKLAGNANIQWLSQSLKVKSHLDITQLEILHADKKKPLLVIDTATLDGVSFVSDPLKGLALSVDQVSLDKLSTTMIVFDNHTNNIQKLFAQKNNRPSAIPSQSSSISNNFLFDIRTIALTQGALDFSDESIKPQFKTAIHDLHGTILGVSNQDQRVASMVLNGLVDKSGEVSVRGKTSFQNPGKNNDFTLIFNRIPLHSMNPYSMTFAGYEIKDGLISALLKYRTTEYELKGQNHFVINKIRLGNKVPNYTGIDLPLGLAVALLEDGDGIINLDIPISGNINHPEFSVGGLVWQAFKNVLSNVVTAPFRAIGHLLGIEKFEGIYFLQGESALHPVEKEKLVHINSALVKSPKSKLIIHPIYDPEADLLKLDKVKIDRLIFQAAGFKIAPSEILPEINLEDSKIQAGIQSVYIARIGYLKWIQKTLTLSRDPQFWKLSRRELIANEHIDVGELEFLAKNRANLVKAGLEELNKDLGNRISIGDIRQVKSEEQGIPLSIEFVTQFK